MAARSTACSLGAPLTPHVPALLHMRLLCRSLHMRLCCGGSAGNCDINGLTPSMNKAFWAPGFGRASISCPTTSLTCTSVGQVITPADLGWWVWALAGAGGGAPARAGLAWRAPRMGAVASV
jgi:hypothetical protein